MKHIYLLSFLILFSCSEKQDKDIIPKEQFTNILEEIYLIKSEYEFNKINNSDYEEILSNHHVSNADFERTLEYYAERPDLLENIYEEMLLNLKEKRKHLN